MNRKKTTEQLLEDWISQEPKRILEAIRVLGDLGIDKKIVEKELKVKIEKPEKYISSIPTFDPKVKRPISPMLMARMNYAGNISDGTQKWLSIQGIEKHMPLKKIQNAFNGFKNDWENSAPAIFRKDQISIFGISRENDYDMIFLVWDQDDDQQEPKIYKYFGQSESIYNNLDEYLKWTVS